MIIYNYYFAILILAIIFFLISNKNPSILIAIIIIIILGYNYFNKINIYNEKINTNYKNKIKTLENDSNEKINYIYNDKYLIELLLNIRFIKIFDNARYISIINETDNLMKIYIYMLSDRYEIKKFFTTFLNLRNEIINELYSSYLIIPSKFKFIYNLNPFEELKKTIEQFIKHTRKMIVIIEKYAFEKKNIKYLQDTKYRPFNYYIRSDKTPLDTNLDVF